MSLDSSGLLSGIDLSSRSLGASFPRGKIFSTFSIRSTLCVQRQTKKEVRSTEPGITPYWEKHHPLPCQSIETVLY